MNEIHDIKDKDITLTPLELINKLGEFDLDHCGVLSHKTAQKIISLPNDGLVEEWYGRVWLNPPYSNPSPWLKKLSEYNNGIALVLNSTDTKWFQEFIFNHASAVLFLSGRPKFTRLDYSKVQIMRGVVLVAYGEINKSILNQCQLSGKVINLN